ncbi:Ulp1 family isopeptidase [endosymbiont GvMRE of Glomus versiforme]|uniref:Ulp1 family isopeptidase n=1 Tax=endosymbiont GvMRE of Glomus versiforme TaxID=2039283 RepID=UPI000EE247B3|nr:Ulp1 family isopeptidase [endosymbiont GvMRE of Glomus versiforme]RHZ36801.1 hypothetical protein GvMRE_I2g600 [endosymbiont GvMRE of Glomus versiforme]
MFLTLSGLFSSNGEKVSTNSRKISIAINEIQQSWFQAHLRTYQQKAVLGENWKTKFFNLDGETLVAEKNRLLAAIKEAKIVTEKNWEELVQQTLQEVENLSFQREQKELSPILDDSFFLVDYIRDIAQKINTETDWEAKSVWLWELKKVREKNLPFLNNKISLIGSKVKTEIYRELDRIIKQLTEEQQKVLLIKKKERELIYRWWIQTEESYADWYLESRFGFLKEEISREEKINIAERLFQSNYFPGDAIFSFNLRPSFRELINELRKLENLTHRVQVDVKYILSMTTNSDEFATQFKSFRLPGNRLDRHWNEVDTIINNYLDRGIEGISGTNMNLLYNLGVNYNDISNNPIDGDKFVGTFKCKITGDTYNLRNGREFDKFVEDRCLFCNPLVGDGDTLWEVPLSEAEQTIIIDIGRTHATNEELDTGWLTDDNIEYILKHENIQQSLNRQNQNNRNWQIRTDIANIYNAFHWTRNSQTLDITNLLRELAINPYRYTIFPLRVSGNHWGMFILENNEGNKRVYYTSSGPGVENEVEQIKPLITKLINQNASNNIQIIHGAKQNNNYDCGVYLIKYIQEILETGNLALNRNITEQECQEFREEWKQKIGENEWCRLDKIGGTSQKNVSTFRARDKNTNIMTINKNIIENGKNIYIYIRMGRCRP